MDQPTPPRRPRFCGQCGAALPPGDARFCIECGTVIPTSVAAANAPSTAEPATGATVRLANANVEQAVVGGTIKLPTSQAVPPGLWLTPEPPGADRVVAIYAPLRAIVGGWSGLIGTDWRKLGQARATDTGRDLVRFETEREWFPAPGCGQNLRLHIRIGASSLAEEGRTRRGFRYRIGADAPMEVLDVWWNDRGRKRDLPTPDIQIMAPPRIQRVSDYDEAILHMNAREADIWAREGAVFGVYRLVSATQQRTPVGRGLVLTEIFGGTALLAFTGRLNPPHRVRIRRPFIVQAGKWPMHERQMRSDAAAVGLDLDTDAVMEWWLDQNHYDGAVFERGSHAIAASGRAVVAFRRSQIAAIEEFR